MIIQIFTTGGTIDKAYFDANNEFQVDDSILKEILKDANIVFDYSVESLMQKDSLELTDEDHLVILERVQSCEQRHILITHGTDTMTYTVDVLSKVTDKTIVLTGAMEPARLRSTDAIFNIGFAVAATQLMSAGIYIAMNGKIFSAGQVKKNRQKKRFELLTI